MFARLKCWYEGHNWSQGSMHTDLVVCLRCHKRRYARGGEGR